MQVDPKRIRERMVREQIKARGISDPATLAAMRKVPRHLFVEEALAAQAYEDHPLPIGHGQTISQPYIVAFMTQALELKPGMKVLEVGAGSGYQSAILAEMGAQVYAIERLAPLYEATRKRLRKLGYDVRLKLGDGTLGWTQAAPFDRILVAAGGPSPPKPLIDQLKDPGLLLIPVGAGRRTQTLRRIEKQGGQVIESDLGGVMFVDLVGEHGWSDS